MIRPAQILIPTSGHAIHSEMEFYFGNVDSAQARINLNSRSATGVVNLLTKEGSWHGTGIPVNLDIIGGPGTHDALAKNHPFCILRRHDNGRQILDLVTAVSTIQLRHHLFDRLYAIYARTFPKAFEVLESLKHKPGDWINIEHGFTVQTSNPVNVNRQIAYALVKRTRTISDSGRYSFARYDLDLHYLSTIVESLLIEMDILGDPGSGQPPIGPGAWSIYFLLYLHKKHACYPTVARAVDSLHVNLFSLVDCYLQQKRQSDQREIAASPGHPSEMLQR